MHHEASPTSHNGKLRPRQNQVLEALVKKYVYQSSTTQEASICTQTAEIMRGNLNSTGFDMSLSTLSELYAVMAGALIATDRMEHLIDLGVHPKEAGRIIVMSFMTIAAENVSRSPNP